MENTKAIKSLLGLCDRYLEGTKLEDVKSSINRAFKERNDVIVKFALAEIHRHGKRIENEDSETVKDLFFYFG